MKFSDGLNRPSESTFTLAIAQYFARRNEREIERLKEEKRALRQKLMIEERAMSKAA